MNDSKVAIKEYSNDDEKASRDEMFNLLNKAPIPDDQLLSNLGLFIESKNLSRILFLDHLFRKILDVQGVVMEFGTRWGQNMALFEALRGIYDPFNRHRKLIAFDSFEGFPSLHEKDGNSEMMQIGQLALPEKYDKYLASVLRTHESLNPLSHIEKFELCKGNATVEVEKYLKKKVKREKDQKKHKKKFRGEKADLTTLVKWMLTLKK